MRLGATYVANSRAGHRACFAAAGTARKAACDSLCRTIGGQPCGVKPGLCCPWRSTQASYPGWQDSNACTTRVLRAFLQAAYTVGDSQIGSPRGPTAPAGSQTRQAVTNPRDQVNQRWKK